MRIDHNFNAAAVRDYVATKYPEAMRSPVAVACREAADDQASSDLIELWNEAFEHARISIDACEADGIAYDAETLAFNIESSFPDLNPEDYEIIAREAIAAFRQ